VIRYLLDTNICIFVLRGILDGLASLFNARANHLAISSVTLAELIYGAEKSAKPEANLAIVEGFAARLAVLPFDDAAAAHSGQIRAELERQGRPIGPYDLMIAGHARALGLVVVTNNRREFERVPGLRVEDWTRA